MFSRKQCTFFLSASVTLPGYQSLQIQSPLGLTLPTPGWCHRSAAAQSWDGDGTPMFRQCIFEYHSLPSYSPSGCTGNLLLLCHAWDRNISANSPLVSSAAQTIYASIHFSLQFFHSHSGVPGSQIWFPAAQRLTNLSLPILSFLQYEVGCSLVERGQEKKAFTSQLKPLSDCQYLSFTVIFSLPQGQAFKNKSQEVYQPISAFNQPPFSPEDVNLKHVE